MEKLIAIIGGLQEHQKIKTDGICTTLCSAMGLGGGQTPLVILKDETDSIRVYGQWNRETPK